MRRIKNSIRCISPTTPTCTCSSEIARIPGVGDTRIFGERQYAMRVWLDPVRLTALGLTATDVVNAIQSQNIQVAAGQIGAPPAEANQQRQLTVLAPGRLSSPQQFANVIVRTNPNGGVVRIKDIGRVQLAAQQYSSGSALDGSPSATLAVYQAPGANALALAKTIEARMKVLSKQFPTGLHYAIVYNATNFVRANIDDILYTLAITLAPGGRRGVPVPAGLARHADPGHRHPGVADRRVRGAVRDRLLRQYGRSVRHRAGGDAGGG